MTNEARPSVSPAPRPDGYKWVALSNTTVGVLLATIDGSIMIIAMPDIFRGIHLNPLAPGNSFYMLWMILGYLVVSSVLVVSVGRLGDMFGRVRMYNLGFVIYTVASLLLTIDWMTGQAGANWLIVMRIVQGIGGAFITGNSAAILTDAFPTNQRGLALGINNIAGISGNFIGLVLGGILAPIDWRLVFLISVPFGLFGTIWAYLRLRDNGIRRREPIDLWGNALFAVGLTLIMIAITSGIQPYRTHAMGWTNPKVLGELVAGVLCLITFGFWQTRNPYPMFRLSLFKIRAYTFGVFSSFLSAIARGGLMFMMVIWLQGIWLPLHGFSFTITPLWAGIYMLPLSGGIMLAGPISGFLSDRFDARLFATGGMLVAAIGFFLLHLLPVDFVYPAFGGALLLMGMANGTFASPNRASVMNSLPPEHRGAGGGMNSTFQNSAQVLSMGIFFSLMIAGLAHTLPTTMTSGLVAHGVPLATAERVSHQPPVSILFASFLGYNPIRTLLGTNVLAHLSKANYATVTGRMFFPSLISPPFRSGLHDALIFAIIACLIAAFASWSRGRRYVHGEQTDEPSTKA
ncbi:MFS transporter [Alicyclobacillus fodiniaquatilis]|uniref:MFS transporter n=1 Tax=Alicyclobacillus fodiniaquatilis TaxID=1661150 RepID=A0ABW4JMH3_9BACL